MALHAIPHLMPLIRRNCPYVVKYNEYIKELELANPYGLPIGLANWAEVEL